MPTLKRKPVTAYVDPEQVRIGVEKLIAEHGGNRPAAEWLSNNFGKTLGAWERMLQRVRHREHQIGVDSEVAEIIALASGVALPQSAYRQRLWRVVGFYPSKRGEAQTGLSMRTWHYMSRRRAQTKVDKLKEQGRFVEWAMAGEVTWRVLE